MDTLSRRSFLRAVTVAAAGAVVLACQLPAFGRRRSGEADRNEGGFAPAPRVTPLLTVHGLSQAPVLDERVAQGKLPALDDRLPQNPLVISMPWQTPGRYGGRQRCVHSWLGGHQEESMYGNSFIRYVQDGLEIAPGLADRWEHNEDKSEWLLYFRKGLKWSDGEPWTVDDVLYWWEDMVLDESDLAGPPDECRSGTGELAEMRKVDDYALSIRFDAPAPLMADRIAMWVNGGIGPRWHAPAHYARQFHPRYSKEHTDTWEHHSRLLFRQNPECPTMTSWMTVAYEEELHATWDRNPYYYALDPEGNQLPYIDGIDESWVPEADVYLAIMNERADFCWHHNLRLSDIPVLERKLPNMEVRRIDSGSGTGSMFFLNQDYVDERYRELFRKRAFQRALSLAWDRAAVQHQFYSDSGELTSGTLSPKAVEYHFDDEARARYVEWRDAWVAYNPVEAHGILDELDIVDTTGDGWRNFPDESPFVIRFEYPAEAVSEHEVKNELLAADWNGIGIQTDFAPLEHYQDLWRTGVLMSNCAWDVGDGPNHLVYPHWLVPIGPDRWAPLQGAMYSVRGTALEGAQRDVDPWERDPPRLGPERDGPVEQLWAIYDEAKVEPDTLARHRLVWDMIEVHVEYGPFFLGCVANTPRLLLVRKDMRNVPTREDLATGGFGNPWIVPHPAVWNPEVFWFEP